MKLEIIDDTGVLYEGEEIEMLMAFSFKASQAFRDQMKQRDPDQYNESVEKWDKPTKGKVKLVRVLQSYEPKTKAKVIKRSSTSF